MKVLIKAIDPLVFRDGRPFGDVGNVSGGILRWPLPETIAGMVRSQIGMHRDVNFFRPRNEVQKNTNLQEILKISIGGLLPVWQEAGSDSWMFLMPKPADALVIAGEQNDTQLGVFGYNYKQLSSKAGVDLNWRNWLVPSPLTKVKVAANQPEYWKWNMFEKWLAGNVQGQEYAPCEIGVPAPEPEVRVHTSISPDTGSAEDHHLFASAGIRFDIRKEKLAGRLAIAVQVEGHQNEDRLTGYCHLGGERRIAYIDSFEQLFPSCPQIYANSKFLRLILATPGDFGGWVPGWLAPPEDSLETPWVEVPGSQIKIRLVSAFVPRWQAVSGWDFVKRAPKAMRKLVPAGAVYLVELEKSENAQELAEHLWGKPLDGNKTPGNGYGNVYVGITNASQIKG